MQEIWKDCKGYEGKYQVSNLGRVWSIGSQKYLKGAIKDGYLKVYLTAKNGKCKNEYIHRLVALAFIPNPMSLPQVNHINKEKTDNCINNLEWCSNKYNVIHAVGKSVYCVELDKTFNCIQAAAEALGLDRGNISKCCNGKRQTCGGYHWRYC